MPNERNLIPFSQRSESEAREYGAKGGRASGVSRRRKKSLREAADLILSLPVRDQLMFSRMVEAGLDCEDVDNQTAVMLALTLEAQTGDPKAAKVLFDLLGEDAKADDEGGVQIIDDL